MVVADVHIKEYNGATGQTNPPATNQGSGLGGTDNVTTINLVNLDAANTASQDYPVTAGTRSFSKWLVYELHDIRDSNKIDNFNVWLTPTPTTTGVVYHSNLNTTLGLTTSIYPTTPVIDDFTGVNDGDVETDNTSWFADVGENIGISESGAVGLSTNGSHSDFIAIQLETTGSTPPGNLPQKTIHFQYDEQ